MSLVQLILILPENCLVLFLAAESNVMDLLKCIMMGYTAHIKKFKKSINIYLNIETLRWNSIAPLEAFSKTVIQRKMFFKIGVLKFFKNFTGKHLCWSLFLINVIKNRLRHRLFPVKSAKFLWTPFYRTPLPSSGCLYILQGLCQD